MTTAAAFFDALIGATKNQQTRLLHKAPWADIRRVALESPDPKERQRLLGFLDHYDNDASMPTFAKALRDPVDYVRNTALHSIACDACKDDALCPADVLPGLLHVLQWDDSADLRMKSIPLLMRIAPADPKVRVSIERCAKGDSDPVVRKVAAEALEGRWFVPAKRYERQQRRHA